MAVEYITTGNDDGSIFGRSDEKISFYGGTPQVQAAFAAAAVETTAAVSTTSAIWGFSTSTQANAIVSLVNEIRAELVALNLVATA